ncbi:MAG: extracellular solute-binding protein [Aerococcus sp.]|nr:extracellular solute-binding protein [Aerococcus sp.]
MKKWLSGMLSMALVLVLAGCGNSDKATANSTDGSSVAATSGGAINVVTREEGSGTRAAFTEITKVKSDQGDGTTSSAIVQNGTDQVLAYVAQDPKSIGYISLGSLNDTVKALKVDGVTPSEETVASGEYPLSRPFNLVHKKGQPLSELATDFQQFILSKQGQEIVKQAGYVPIAAKEDYQGKDLKGQLNISGSTSVGPVMEKLAEAYQKQHANVKINITQNGSGAGIQAASEGSSDFGMASRALAKDEEDKLEATVIANDGIAVIVNKENSATELKMDDLKAIYLGDKTSW